LQACNARLCAKIDAQTSSIRDLTLSIVDESASDQFSSEDYIVIKNSSSGVEDFYLHRFVARVL
jgi:hypothetical protein